jgi:glycosyltransferase involved in cell wall biosynthesis
VRVALVFNRYLNRGGEDEVFEAESRLLERNGHAVIPVCARPEDPSQMGRLGKARLAADVVWSRSWYRRMLDLLDRHRPDLVHVHNVFPTMSPAVFHACKVRGLPVVQTLHNQRITCPAAVCFRDGHVCNDCVGRRLPWPGVLHGCYQESRPRTAVVATMLGLHRALGTWTRCVDLNIALTEWGRRRFVTVGLPAGSLVVKPNFVDPDPGVGTHETRRVLFVGRLSANKGVGTLLAAWRRVPPGQTLTVVGTGPLETQLAEAPAGVEWLGWQSRARVLALMQEAACLVFPSEWYEGFPMVLAEAFATGLPVIASRLGAMEEIVEDGRTGVLFTPGDAEDLAAKLAWGLGHTRALAEMGRNGRAEFEAKYTAPRNYELLMAIYRVARERANGQVRWPPD